MINEELTKEVDELISYVMTWEEKVKKLRNGPEIIKKAEANKRYYTPEYQVACQQIMNDLGELFFSEGRVSLHEIELIVLKNLDNHFTRTAITDMAQISIRTVRNKLNEGV